MSFRPLRSRATLAALALAATLAGAIFFAAGPGRARAATATPACATGGLVVWLDTQGSGTAGSVVYTVELTNLSGRACALSGYPRVAAVDLAGRQLGSGSIRFVSRKPNVTLRSGATASFALQIVEVENFPASTCRPVTAAGLRVFPPHQNASKVVPFPFRACSRSGPDYLSAQAVQGHA